MSKDEGEKAGTREVRAAGPLPCGAGGGCTPVGEAGPQRMRQDPRGPQRMQELRGGGRALVWGVMTLKVLWGRCVKRSLGQPD